jgi:hypothetical protein
MTWEDAVEAQAEWHKDMARQSRVTELTAEQMLGIVTILEFPDGFRWVDVQTEVCLKHEGTVMGHCVGAGGYTQGVKEGTTKIISLRDGNNNPHATIEGQSTHPIIVTPAMLGSGQADLFSDNAVEESFMDMTVIQIKGKENKAVVRKYREYVQDFLTKFQIEKFGGMGINDLENSGLFKLHDYGYTTMEDAGKEITKMDDATIWYRISNDEVVLKDYTTQLAAKWYLYDKSGRSIGGMTEKEEGFIYQISFPNTNGYGNTIAERETYGEHIKRAFASGVIPDSSLYNGFFNTLEGFGLGVNNNKVGYPKDVGKLKGTTASGDIYATDGGQNGDMYWVMNGDKVQSRFIINDKREGLGYVMVFDTNRGLPKGSLMTFIKDFQNMDKWNVVVNYVQLHDRTIEVANLEWKPGESSDFIMEEDGVKFYTHVNEQKNASDPDWKRTEGDDTWYVAVDQYDHVIFSMNIEKANFKVKYVSDKKIAGYYAVYLLEHLEVEEDIDIGDKTNYSSFARELLDETDWFQSDYRRGMTQLSQAQNIWMVMDDNYPIHFIETHSYDDGTEENVYDEDTTMAQYWSETGLQDSGMEVDYFAGEFDQVYNSGNIGWDDEHDGYDQEGEGPEHTRTDYHVEGIGDEKTVMHPISGGSMRISL